MRSGLEKTLVGAFFLALSVSSVFLFSGEKVPLVDRMSAKTFLLTLQAALGNPEKQYALAMRTKSEDEFHLLLQSAHAKGFVPASLMLASTYRGKGPKPYDPQDIGKAIEIYQGLSDRGFPVGDAELCRVHSIDYEGSDQVFTDHRKAFDLCKKAAAHNNATALFILSLMYFEGSDIPKEDLEGGLEKGGHYLKRAAELDLIPATSYIQKLREGCFARKQATDCERLAYTGDSQAQLRMGRLYQQGIFFEKNISSAIEWFKRADAQGNAKASLMLGMIYTLEKDGIEIDPVLATQYFKSAQQNQQKDTTTRDRLDAGMWLSVLDMKEQKRLEAEEN